VTLRDCDEVCNLDTSRSARAKSRVSALVRVIAHLVATLPR
jgi:hypothetical protein